jgi:excisionase family DNA binding protein
MSEPWLSVEDAARYLGVSAKSVRRRAAQLGAVKFGTRLLFRASSIDRFLEAQSLQPRRGKGGGNGLRRVS